MEVTKVVLCKQLLKDLIVELKNENLTLMDVWWLKACMDTCNLLMDSFQMQRLYVLFTSGSMWEDKVKQLLDKKDRMLEELEKFM